MPEGPEARTISDKLRPFLLNRTLSKLEIDERGKVIGRENLKIPAVITKVHSYGKKVIFDVSTGFHIITSLGMSGRYQYKEGKHSHVKFHISEIEIVDGISVTKSTSVLYFDDTRYMGGIDIVPTENYPKYMSALGPDLLEAALTQEISKEKWLQIFTGKPCKRAICELLIDQSYVAGQGNYLRCDILYYSGIHPKRAANTLTKEEWEKLRDVSHKVIKLAYHYRGHTIESFVSPDGELGTYPAAVYKKDKDPNGYPVERMTVSGRTVHWVPMVQK